MGINWAIVATIAAPLVALGVTVFLLRRPMVTTYLGHASAHPLAAVDGRPPFDVHTHSLVIQKGIISESGETAGEEITCIFAQVEEGRSTVRVCSTS